MTRPATIAALVLAILIAGCRTVPPTTVPSSTWEERRAHLQARERFEIKGRAGIVAGQDGFTAGLHWMQSGGQSQLDLQGPLGVGGVHISANGDALSLINSRGEHLDSDAARAELQMRLGFDAPLASLRYWILGVPDPAQAAGTAAEVLDVEHRLTSLQQAGWQIDYADYVAVKGEWLPGRVTLQRANVRVRLIVDHWEP